jgi:HSP20 family protein
LRVSPAALIARAAPGSACSVHTASQRHPFASRAARNRRNVMANLVKQAPESAALPTAWDPFRAMRAMMARDPFRELSSFVGGAELAFSPDFDVKETNEAYVLRGDVPGMAEKDLVISLAGNMLTISGKREQDREEKTEQYFYRERSSGSFSRAFTLPDAADGEHIRADLAEGVLSITIPKRGDLRAKRIEVNGGKAKSRA